MQANFEFTLELSTSAFTCIGADCGRVVKSGEKILYVNGRRRDFCAGCARSYLKSFIKILQRIEGCTYALCDNTVSARLRARLERPPDVIEEKDIDSILPEKQQNI